MNQIIELYGHLTTSWLNIEELSEDISAGNKDVSALNVVEQCRKAYESRYGIISWGNFLTVGNGAMLIKSIASSLSPALSATDTQGRELIFSKIMKDCNYLFEKVSDITLSAKILPLNDISNPDFDVNFCYGILDGMQVFTEEIVRLCAEYGIDTSVFSPHKYLSDRFDLTEFDKILKPLSSKDNNSQDYDLASFFVRDAEKCIKFIERELDMCATPQGKLVAIILIALNEKGYLGSLQGNKVKLHKALKILFKEKIGHRQSVMEYLDSFYNPDSKSIKSITNQELQPMIEKLKNI